MNQIRRDDPPVSHSPGRDLGRELSTAVVMFHEAVASRLGLSATEWRCWGLLEKNGPSTAGRLAELSGFTTGAITGIVDRLEKAGYVRRKRHPTDRRSVVIHPLKVAGMQRAVWPIFSSLSAAMDAMAARYTPEQLAAIHEYWKDTVQVLGAETAKVMAGKKRAK